MAEQLATGFKSVLDFRQQRSPLAALGFYAFHLLMCVLLGGIAGAITGVILSVNGIDRHQETFKNITFTAGSIIAVLYVIFLNSKIISSRKKWSSPWYILTLIGSIILAVIGGGLLGVIPSAVTLGTKLDSGSGEPSP